MIHVCVGVCVNIFWFGFDSGVCMYIVLVILVYQNGLT